MNPLVLVNDDGIRPAGLPNQCFYCNQKVGQPHKDDCVILLRKVKVKYTFEIEIEVPHYWKKEDIKFHRNDSSWCANNAISELKELANNNCLCGCFSAEVIEIPEVAPYRTDNKGNIVP